MMRQRIWWIRSYMSCLLDQLLSASPYCCSDLGVLPPLWSSAAMNPGALRIFWHITSYRCASTLAPPRFRRLPASCPPPGTQARLMPAAFTRHLVTSPHTGSGRCRPDGDEEPGVFLPHLALAAPRSSL